ncbi:MAG: DegT/DnrJ/EryC1/StrS family aminotransferase [Gammaproteobacteria bacterium]|nr:DegT/DnrJ/EryC1/StrS family aminotransferase [Gammaproteobacteria bacterium]
MQFIDLKSQQQLIRADLDRRIAAILDHGQYILGPEIGEMESQLAEFVGVRHCISVASGTDALLLALMALDIGPGDEVITTPFSFISTAEVIGLLGATPVFVDIDERTFNIRADLIEAAISDKTRALMPVSLFGQCADMAAINAIGERHGLPVIEDAAQSFGAEQSGRRSCGLSRLGCTSFFPAKPLGCYGDGGACFTDDDDLAGRLRELRNHGQDRRYHHPRIGINGRMDTLQAAVILAKMALFPDEVHKRSTLGARYSELLGDTDCITPHIADGNLSVYAQYTLRVRDRDKVAAQLGEAGIPTAVYYPITLDQQPALATCSRTSGDLATTHRLAAEVISLPMHPYLQDADMAGISDAVTRALD